MLTSSSYIDPYVATKSSDSAFVGGKSIVIHYPNKTRIACANLVQLTAGSNSTSGYGNSTASGTSSSTGSSSGSGSSSSGSGSRSGSGTSSSGSTTSASSPKSTYTGAAAVAGIAKGALALVAGGLAFVI